MSTVNDRIDELEYTMRNEMPPVECPVIHSFSPGFYIRQIFMPAGTLLTSQIHRTRHSYQVTKGVALVKINDEEWETIEAPFVGITEPGTRRLIYIDQDCTWTTFHSILESEQPEFMLEEEISEAVDRIGERIIEPHINELLGGQVKNNTIVHKATEIVLNETKTQ